MKVTLTVLALGMLSCGQQDLANVGNVGDEVNKFGYKVSTTDDIIGKNANDARSHMSDRGFSSEEIGHEVSTADDIAGEQANHARKHMSDRGASGEQIGDKAVEAKKHTGKKYHEGKDHTGKKANESREYTYTRGVQEMRHGDQDTQDAIQANKEKGEQNAEAITAIELVNKMQDIAAARLANRIMNLEHAAADLYDRTNALAVADGQLSSAIEALDGEVADKLAVLLAQLEAADADLADAIESNSELIDALTSELALLEEAMEEAIEGLEVADRSLLFGLFLTRVQLSSDIRDIARDLHVFKRQQQSLNRLVSYKLSMLQRKVGALERGQRHMTRLISWIAARLSNLENEVEELSSSVEELSDELYEAIEELEDSIETIEADIDSINGVAEIVDPCGDGRGFDEVLLVMDSGAIIAWYKNLGLVVLDDGYYRTTDKQRCRFQIEDGEINEDD